MKQSIFLTAADARKKIESELNVLKSNNIVMLMEAINMAVERKQFSVKYPGVIYDESLKKLEELGYKIIFNSRDGEYSIEW